ncbi:hypothetical protein [Halioxenophilus aromaticivorans]|uniref:Uncharacterized protein n=1 Tax=Halioxenophilus aromaticivorans TaxID=1306992 RepID=A0AAV3TXT7_9ALTE
MTINSYRAFATATLLASATALTSLSAFAGNKNGLDARANEFQMTRPAALSEGCATKAKGFVRITPVGEAERMEIFVQGMPANSEVEVFTIQVPEFPFGMSWYVGDIKTNAKGKGYASFVSRFNEETFVVAPGEAIATLSHDADAATNPATAPVHTYHVGIWFDSPEDAISLGCPGIQTPFNGDHTAGIQVLNTGRFPDTAGPLLD